MHVIQYLHVWLSTHVKDERGATMVEYGLMVALVAVVAALGATALGISVDALFDDVAADIAP